MTEKRNMEAKLGCCAGYIACPGTLAGLFLGGNRIICFYTECPNYVNLFSAAQQKPTLAPLAQAKAAGKSMQAPQHNGLG